MNCYAIYSNAFDARFVFNITLAIIIPNLIFVSRIVTPLKYFAVDFYSMEAFISL